MIDEPFFEVIKAASEVIERAGIIYAVTGSIASSIHGEPIVSQDVDIAVRMTPQQASELAEQLPARFYRSDEHIAAIAIEGGIANLIDTETALKVDLCALARTPFYDLVMTRRAPVSLGVGGISFHVVSAEDIILMKLEWRKETLSNKQWENALSVARVQRNRLDWKYLFDQARTLDVEGDLTKLRDEAGI